VIYPCKRLRNERYKMIKVLIVDDEKLICEGLSLILGTYDDIDILGTCNNGMEALRFCRQTTPDVVLMDIRMDVCDGVEGTKLIKEMNPAINILILTTFMDDEYIHTALKNGASGYLLKDSSSDRIYEAIKSVNIGNIAMTPQIAQKMVNTNGVTKAVDKLVDEYSLTEKDVQLIQLICEGMSNKEISETLFLSEGTVKNNIGKLLSKLGLRDRTQIAIFAFKNGIVKH
jgi:DNA-binding NarL/FixJ family response regulator